MAHSTEIQGFVFIHNGDYSGDVEIVHTGLRVKIPFSALAEFVAGYVVGERIAALEQASPLDVLLGRTGVRR